MKSSRTNNSILFLTTLGVYLGLVLVGATPVLGHAATTRVFEITDEIETKDDLDRKPDDELAIDQFSVCFEELVRVASEWSAKNSSNGSLDELLSFDYFVSVKPSGGAKHTSPSAFNNGPRISLGKNSRPLHQLYDAFLDRDPNWHEKFFVQFTFGFGETSLKATILESDPLIAEAAADAYSKALARKLAAETTSARILILRSMQITADGDRVILVSRLPRGSLDSLFAKDAK